MTDERMLESDLRAAIAGDEAAYRRFLVAVTPVLRQIAAAGLPLSERSMTEDVVQEVLLTVHLKRGSWDSTRPLMPWLRVIVRHKAIDALRRRPKARHEPVEDHEALADPAPIDPLRARLVEQMLGRLPERDAALLRAHAIDGVEPADLASRYDMQPGALRVALHRALSRLAAMARKEDERG